MFLIPLLAVFVIIALLVIVGPALLPLAIVAGIVYGVYKGMEHHRQHDTSIHSH